MLTIAPEIKKAATREVTAPSRTARQQEYRPSRPLVNRPRQIFRGCPDRRPPLPPTRPANQPCRPPARLERVALVLTALIVQLQIAHHLSFVERQGGWAVAEKLLSDYIATKHASEGA